jgi:hypothetical protein
VESWVKFAAKIGGVVVCANALCAGLYWMERQKQISRG